MYYEAPSFCMSVKGHAYRVCFTMKSVSKAEPKLGSCSPTVIYSRLCLNEMLYTHDPFITTEMC